MGLVPTSSRTGVGNVESVTAGDTSIVVGGTATAPTIETGTLDVIAADHPPAGNWSNNGHKITGLANGTAATDAATVGQLTDPVPTVITLTSAQILTLHTVPVLVIAAAGAGMGIFPYKIVANYIAGATAYTDGGGGLGLTNGSGGGNALQIINATAGFWDQATSQVVHSGAPVRAGQAVSSIANTAIYIEQDTANPTLGTGTLKLTIYADVLAIS